MTIEGGYILKPRSILDSQIYKAPPHVREIWDHLLLKANHADDPNSGIKRGQVWTCYAEIREALSWKVGWRTERYTKWQCEIAMKLLTRATMITTKKTTRGLIVTISNYDYYQDPANYENHSESHQRATRKPQTTDTINKKKKNAKNERIRKKSIVQTKAERWEEFWQAYPKKQAKGQAQKVYERAVSRDGVSETAIIAGIKTSPQLQRQKQYIPLPATWLNGEGWNDEPQASQTELDLDPGVKAEIEKGEREAAETERLTQEALRAGRQKPR